MPGRPKFRARIGPVRTGTGLSVPSLFLAYHLLSLAASTLPHTAASVSSSVWPIDAM